MKKIILIAIIACKTLVSGPPHLEHEVYERYRVDDSMKVLLDEHKDEIILAFNECDLLFV